MKHKIEIGIFFGFVLLFSISSPSLLLGIKESIHRYCKFFSPWERQIVENAMGFPFSFGALKFKKDIFLSCFKVASILAPSRLSSWPDFNQARERCRVFAHQFLTSAGAEGRLAMCTCPGTASHGPPFLQRLSINMLVLERPYYFAEKTAWELEHISDFITM